jgi:molybdopterin-guanine dinucleotide biosynthesis protein B
VKNSGKTTLLTRIIPLLKALGLKVAVIKHDGHDFTPDVPGTDSFRLRAAGAEAVAVYSPHRFLLTVEKAGTAPEEFLPFWAGFDLVLLEGGKNSPYPKIEIVRQAISSEPVSRPDTLLALCTDTGLTRPGLTVLGLDDYEALARLIHNHLRQMKWPG